MESLTRANSLFALDLYRALSASNAEGNMLFSPLSISAALSMVYLGARGDTAAEMAKALEYPSSYYLVAPSSTGSRVGNFFLEKVWVCSFISVSDLHSNFETLISSMNSSSAFNIVRLANRLYGEKTFNFLPEYLDSTLKLYHADLQAVDFFGASEQSRQLINNWVEEKTENKIRGLLQPGMVTEMTRLVLVNAIYFKANWMHIFEAKHTTEMPFKINQNKSQPVKIMCLNKNLCFKRIPEYKLQVLELVYESLQFSMLILLPDETQDGSDPLLKLENELTLDKLLDWTKLTTSKNVIVRLPKFKLEIENSLSKTLEEMGMSSVFQESKADLTGMSSKGGLFISAVIHKAFVEVNEKGTEAAAATCPYLTTGFVPRPIEIPHYFIADHPFMFFIRHYHTNSILFLGRFRGPS